jgi:Ran GTPase-activating protein (RanGAP) involved in mRNA processing and transport
MATSASWRVSLEDVLREGDGKLDLRRSDLFDEDAATIAERLRGSNSSVTRLFMGGNNVGDKGAAALAELLRDNGGLRLLDLSENKISGEGVRALAGSLKQNNSLSTLWLMMNTFWLETGAVAAVESLVSAIGVNTALDRVLFGPSSNRHQKAVNDALADVEGRRRGREQFLSGSVKSAHKRD